MDMRLPVYAARDAQRALDKLFDDCRSDEACRAAYPRLPERTQALLARLDAKPPHSAGGDPRTGVTEDIAITSKVVASILFSALYSPLTGRFCHRSSSVPSTTTSRDRWRWPSRASPPPTA